jgi:hypothetical protein
VVQSNAVEAGLTEEVSRQVVAQRIRNRLLEIAIGMAAGEQYVREVGAIEWFELFFDWMPRTVEQPFYNSSMTDRECEAVSALRAIVLEACAETPQMVTDDQLISSGWLQRVQPVANRLVTLMKSRGISSEDVEENEPSIKQA